MEDKYIRETVYGMKKEAFGWSWLTTLAGNAGSALVELGTTGSVYLLALAATAGIGAGYAGAKMSAHGDQDIDTAKKEYENERLKADLGYLKTKTESEYDAFKRAQPPKPARIIT